MNLLGDWKVTVFMAIISLICGLVSGDIIFALFFIVFGVIAYFEARVKKENIGG